MQQVEIKGAVGKTIKAVVPKWDGSELLIVFQDETHAILEVVRGYDPGDEEIQDGRLDVLHFGERALVDAGLVTETQAKELREKHEAACAASQLERDRQQFERLRKQFES